MPIYEYRCQDCGRQFEKLIRNQQDIPSACPECGQAQLKKLFSTFSATVASAARTPCSGGACPMESPCAAGRSPCASGKCPF